MKLFTYDDEMLEYNEYTPPKKLPLYKIIFISGVLFFLVSLNISESDIKYKTYEQEKVLLVNEEDSFNKDRLVDKLKSLNIRFPYIVLAQTIQETGHYSSKIFKENHNLFGMKEARVRINLAIGTQYGHALYNSWDESVLDYAFWCATYAYKCKTEDQYYQLLDRQYAEDPNYTTRLKDLVQRYNLKEKFSK